MRRKGLRLLDLGSATHVTEQGGTLSTSGTSDIARPSGSDISVLTQPIPLPGLPGCCIGVSVLLMPSNRDKLRRTRDGRYEVGVYIEKDKYARYVAKVLVAYEREGVSQVAMTMPPAPNFDLAAKAGHSWALEHIPAIYKFSPEDLVVTLLDGPEFEKVKMS